MEYADNDASSTTMKLSMHTLLRCPLAVSKSIAAKSFIVIQVFVHHLLYLATHVGAETFGLEHLHSTAK